MYMTHPDLFIKQMEIGPMANYIYFVGSKSLKQLLVVDPAWDVDCIRAEAATLDMQITAALITHGHPDHTNGINDLLKTHDIPIYVSKHEASFYKPIAENVTEVSDADILELADIKIEFMHTPGHTPGSQCFLLHGNLVSGDTLFLDGCGRCDLPGGDAEIMFDTISNKLLKLPDSTIIYPGHNYHHLDCDSLQNQKQTNHYLRCNNLHEFIHQRL
jgi:hydroxyacylglutathione hydrolase